MLKNNGWCVMTIQQEKMYLMLKEIDKISKEFDLLYYLSYGTLLGAIRHEGYIPWDCDTDIIVSVKDYEKFCSSLSKHLPSEYKLFSWELDPDYTELFSR